MITGLVPNDSCKQRISPAITDKPNRRGERNPEALAGRGGADAAFENI